MWTILPLAVKWDVKKGTSSIFSDDLSQHFDHLRFSYSRNIHQNYNIFVSVLQWLCPITGYTLFQWFSLLSQWCFWLVDQTSSVIWVNSLTPWRFQWNQVNLVIDGWVCHMKLLSRDHHLTFSNDRSKLVQLMAWCGQATSHYLTQCSMSSVGHDDLLMDAHPQCIVFTKMCCLTLVHDIKTQMLPTPDRYVGIPRLFISLQIMHYLEYATFVIYLILSEIRAWINDLIHFPMVCNYPSMP